MKRAIASLLLRWSPPAGAPVATLALAESRVSALCRVRICCGLVRNCHVALGVFMNFPQRFHCFSILDLRNNAIVIGVHRDQERVG